MTCSVIAQGRAIHCCLQELIYEFINVLLHDVLVRVWNEFGRSVDTTTANVSFANLCIILVNYFLYIYGYPYGNGRRFPFAPLLAAFALLGMLEGVRASSECREWTFKDAGQSFGTGRCRLLRHTSCWKMICKDL
jgi:hypothetical protein